MKAVFAALVAGVALIACDRTAPQTGASTTSDSAPSPVPAPVAVVCEAGPAGTDRTICPPDRIGPIRRTTTRDQLATWFRDTPLVDEDVNIGEGEVAPGTVIHRGRPDSAAIVWKDSTRSAISSVMRLGPAWRTPEGIGVGSTLEDLEKAIGPFNVLGFGWDYGGTVMLEGTRAEVANGILFYRLAPAVDSLSLSPEYARVRGDKPYASISPDVRALRLVVRAVDINWEN